MPDAAARRRRRDSATSTSSQQETHKLEAIIGDLLDLARLEGGGDTLDAERRAASKTCSAASRDRHQPDARAIESITADDRRRRRHAEDLRRPDRLEQALQNLAANAHPAHAGRRPVKLSRASRAGGRVRITVRDTGPGIPAEHLPHDLRSVLQGGRVARRHRGASGSGLGLSIVQAIVERHGGSVTARNAPEGGAVFELRLPAA